MTASVAQAPIASPWDALADSYDRLFTESAVGRAQRTAVQTIAAQTFPPGSRILELNCGTGADAVFLARRGVRVDAFDSSPKMVQLAADAVRRSRLDRRVRVAVLPTERIGALAGSYDGAFSNFSGLNCVADLGSVARDLARVLRPRAHALLCFSTRVCAWEIAWYSLRADFHKAFRRLRAGGITAELAPGAFVHVQYPAVRTIRALFAPHFRLTAIAGIGIAVPPSYAESLARKHPRLLRAAERFDESARYAPLLRATADHVLLRFRRCEA